MTRNNSTTVAWVLAGLTMVAVVGCAAAYHDYPCGAVPLDYCPPMPLPYAGFDNCPTPIAREYFSKPSTEDAPAEKVEDW